MTRSREAERISPEHIAVLTQECAIRIVDFSVTGCLIETNRRFEVGSVASLRVVIDGREFTDDVQFVRCQPIAGAGSTFHVGARFLWTQPLRDQSFRGALRMVRVLPDDTDQTQ